MKEWFYDEYKHCGVDYSKAEQAEIYDDRHTKFRDYKKEFDNMMDFLELENTKDKTVIDIGCGTGTTSIFAAGLFGTVYAVDISNAMIEKAAEKLDKTIHNLKFANGGFLTYEHKGEPADLIITKMAFHHLPDFWKQIALLRINKMMKMGGTLYIHDVVFGFDPHQYEEKIDSWAAGLEKIAGKKFKSEIEMHIRNEYSTFGWIMKGMLERAGFAVEKCRSDDDFLTEYACRKVSG